MERIRIQLPSSTSFSYHYRLKSEDINHANHMGNDRILTIVQLARHEFFSFLGVSEIDIGEGTATIISAAAVEYLAEGFLDDDLEIKVFVSSVLSKGFDLAYDVVKNNGQSMARIRTSILAYDYEKKKITDLPANFRQMLVEQMTFS